MDNCPLDAIAVSAVVAFDPNSCGLIETDEEHSERWNTFMDNQYINTSKRREAALNKERKRPLKYRV
jgi:hypothetical protein